MIKFNNNKLKIDGLGGKYKIMLITDTHFTLFGENETPERAEYAKPRVPHFSDRVNGRTPYDCVREYIDYANANNFDLVIFSGDIIDFPSPENIAALRNVLSYLMVPYVYVPGNHDWSYFNNYHTEDSVKNELPLLREFCNGDTSFQKIQIGELTFVGLDNTRDVYDPALFSRVEEVLKTEKNVVFIQHVPFSCPELEPDTIRIWTCNICLGGTGIRKDDTADKMRELICSYPSSKAILTGHLHDAIHCDLLNGKVPQYVCEISCYGVATVFEIEP